jgi:hypothetical protein
MGIEDEISAERNLLSPISCWMGMSKGQNQLAQRVAKIITAFTSTSIKVLMVANRILIVGLHGEY